MRRALSILSLSALLVACGDDEVSNAVDAGTDAAIPEVDAAAPIDASSVDSNYPFTPPVELGRHDVEVLTTRQVVPSDGLPPEVAAMPSNNNLDVVRFGGKVILAYRTGPDHFASPETRIHVVSSEDEVTWDWEASFNLETDLREPRFLEVGGKLFLYLARLGTNSTSFEPQGMSLSERHEDGTWGELEEFYEPGYLGWRTRNERGTAYMTTYVGGEHIYDFSGLPISVALLTTTNGRDWAPVNAERPFVYVGGGSETDFVLADDGTLYGVIRNEAGDENGFGSMVCHAHAEDITDWSCNVDKRKYDSPLMFWHDGEAYLVGRRNLTETGWYDVSPTTFTVPQRGARNQIAYWNVPKRCSLWRYVQEEDRIAFVLDLPSRGDTCFAGILNTETEGEFVLYNYSSPIDGPDVGWRAGQGGDTNIYRHTLRFTPRER